jgi:hypothetical protein
LRCKLIPAQVQRGGDQGLFACVLALESLSITRAIPANGAHDPQAA